MTLLLIVDTMDALSITAIFIIGFLGGVHCVGMCGGLSSAFVLQLPKHMKRWPMVLLLNIGRISSYVIIGALLGSIGHIGIGLDKTQWFQQSLFVFANIILIFMGLYLAGLSQGILKLEALGKPIWKYLNPLLGKLLPIRSYSGSLIAGALWGWLPCGLVYSASSYSLMSGSAFQGALIMLAFGLGTLPNLLLIGFIANTIKNFLQKKWVRLITGILVMGIAIVQLILFFQSSH